VFHDVCVFRLKNKERCDILKLEKAAKNQVGLIDTENYRKYFLALACSNYFSETSHIKNRCHLNCRAFINTF